MKERLISSLRLIQLVWKLAKTNTSLIVFAASELLITILLFAGTLAALYLYDPTIWTTIETFLLTPAISTFPLGLFVGFVIFGLSMMILSHVLDAYSYTLAVSTIRRQQTSILAAHKLVMDRILPITKFSFVSSTIGLVLLLLEDTSSWFGTVFARFTHGSWNLATTFALPLIIDKKADTTYTATKQSVLLLTESFGENIVVRGANTAVISVLFFLVIGLGVASTITAIIFANPIVVWVVVIIFGLCFAALVTLTVIVRAVTIALLYEFVTRGGDELSIHQDVFKSMITTKRAAEVFSQ